jgi:acetyl-CoA carboxylase carboxyl transferase subunit alpha
MAKIEHPLDFEKPLVEIEAELDILRDEVSSGKGDKRDEYAKLEAKASKLRKEIYTNLTPYQRVQLSRHFDRPFTLDFIRLMVTDFVELHGDRLYRDDPAIVSGLGKIGGVNVVIVGHQRGRTLQERVQRNFGMPQPDGYRKALRMFRLAEKFGRPIVCLIDTQGAYPGLEAEERGQAEAIARNLQELSEVTVPVIAVVIGEGGSGGALALGVADKVLMLENACYSVITPEGCASILWQHERGEAPQNQAATAAEMLKITASDCKGLGVVDDVVSEPIGGAHWNHKETAENLKAAVLRHLESLSSKTVGDLVESRYQKYKAMGPYTNVA